MNVTVFATVGQVAVLKQFSFLLFLVLSLFSCREKNRSSPMGFHHHLKWSLLCVWFSPTVKGDAFFLLRLLAPGEKKNVVKITV